MAWLSDFFFTGAGVLPLVFFGAGDPLAAALSALAGCVLGALFSAPDPEAPFRSRPPP